MSLLNDLELEILKEIRDASYSELLNGKDSTGIPFLQQIFKLHQKIYGGTCSYCSSKISGYIFKLKNFNPNLQMETIDQNFQLKTGAMIIVPGSSESYSNANLTDDIAIAYIAKNPNRKQLFKKLPDNVDELIIAFNEKEEEVFLTDQNAVTIGETKITVEQALAYLSEIGVQTRAKTVDGVTKKISELTAEQITLLNAKVNPAPAAPSETNLAPDSSATASAPATPESDAPADQNAVNVGETKITGAEEVNTNQGNNSLV